MTTSETVEGRVESTNERGIRVAGEWHPDDPNAWWITLDTLAGAKRTPFRESCRRAISRLAAAGELERGWLQGWGEQEHVYAAADLPDPRSMDRLLCCRVPPTLVKDRAVPTLRR